jgi:hypothetical protein
MPSDANGVPFSAGYLDAAGNLIANMRPNAAAEAVGRTLATRLLELTDDAGMKDMLKFLIAAPRCTSSSGWRCSRSCPSSRRRTRRATIRTSRATMSTPMRSWTT